MKQQRCWHAVHGRVWKDGGASLARGLNRLQVTLIRPVRDLRNQVPLYEVALALPSIKATLSDREYQLITSVAGANLAEARREPEAALWLQRRHLPGPTAQDYGTGSDDEGPEPHQVIVMHVECERQEACDRGSDK